LRGAHEFQRCDWDPKFSDAHALRCELATEVLRSCGKLRLRVTGSSMLPTIFPGDTLLIERTELSDTEKGDIVLISRDGRLFAHRLIDKVGEANPALAITKGDSMSAPDPAVKHDKVLGRISSIVRDGRVFQPQRRLRFPARAVAALARTSDIATRVVIGVHGLRSPAPRPKSQS
jgi:signal peptidase